MRRARKKWIIPEYNERVSHNLDVLAKVLGVQLKEVKRWRREGFISFPVLECEFEFMVRMMNTLWGNYSAVRCQMAVMSKAKRESLVRTADLSGFELEVFNLVLRWKLQFPRRYLHFKEARNQLRARFPNGYLQLDAILLNRAKKAANYAISKARKTDRLDMLLEQMSLQDVDGKIRPKKRSLRDTSKAALNDLLSGFLIPDKVISTPPPVGNESSKEEMPKQHIEKDLTAEEIRYLEENFLDSYERGKRSLRERLKCSHPLLRE
jgi:hypothetical protein